MMKCLSFGLLVSTLSLAAGCSSSNDHSTCSPEDGLICAPKGFPFATVSVAASDLCGGPVTSCSPGTNPPPNATTTTANLNQPEPGKLCLSGTVLPGGWAQLYVGFTTLNTEETKVLKTFDAADMGITQVDFTIDSPPAGGVKVEASVTTKSEFKKGDLFFDYGFTLTDSSTKLPKFITMSEPQQADFRDFEQTRTDMSQTFNTKALNAIAFTVGAGAYDFCIHDFKFSGPMGDINPR
jgi:hypothetical protein